MYIYTDIQGCTGIHREISRDINIYIWIDIHIYIYIDGYRRSLGSGCRVCLRIVQDFQTAKIWEVALCFAGFLE